VNEETSVKLSSFELFQNYPNPFNPSTNIGFRIPNSGFVSLKIYDILGNEVATVVNEVLAPGEYHFPFSISHLPLSSGVYFYSLRAEKFFETKKFLLIK
jgi:hypothetical protein